MFWSSSKKRVEELEKKTQESFRSVKKDIETVSQWIKHLDSKDKQLFDMLENLKQDISSISEELEGFREGLNLVSDLKTNKQLLKKLPVLGKQTPDEVVQKVVQTAVQTDNIYNIFKSLSGNERLLVFTLMNTEMKLSYEDLAMMLGKDKSTVRGQVNSIKQKSEGLINEISEKNGKKRVFIPAEIREKLQKYGKVRVGKEKK